MDKVNQHKSLAMTGKLSNNKASGGLMSAPQPGAGMATKTPKMPKTAIPGSVKPLAPLTVAKRNNGVPGMKKGGAKC